VNYCDQIRSVFNDFSAIFFTSVTATFCLYLASFLSERVFTATAVHLLHLTTYFTKTSFLAKIENLRPCSSLRDIRTDGRTDGRTDIQIHADYNIYALCYSSRVKNDILRIIIGTYSALRYPIRCGLYPSAHSCTVLIVRHQLSLMRSRSDGPSIYGNILKTGTFAL
jgi:hypothetical protein